MKSIILTMFSIVLLLSCNDEPIIERSNSCQDITFDTSFDILLGESACLPDGRSLRLIEARDEFCPCDAVCVWEGQLLIVLETEDQNGEELEVIVGSTDNVPFGSLFEDVTIAGFTYQYNGTNDSLPLCEGVYDPEELTVVLTLSN